MEQEDADKRSHVLIGGRGVTAAQQIFNLPDGGSNPHDLTAASPQ